MIETQEWYSAKELAGAPGMPGTVKYIIATANRELWQSRKRVGRGGGREYHISALPIETRRALAGTVQGLAQTGTDEHAGAMEGRKLALADKTIKLVEARTAEARLKAASELPDRERARDLARTAILADWAAYRHVSGEPVNDSLISYALLYNMGSRPVQEQYPSISYPTLRNWRHALKVNGHLGAKYGNRKGTGKIDRQPELKAFVVAMMTEHPHCNSEHVLMGIKARFKGTDIEIPSQGRLHAWMEKWKEKNGQVFTSITSPDALKNNYMPAFGNASENIIKLNQCWQLDATPSDVMFTDGRYAVSGVFDVYSRRGKVLVTPQNNAKAVVALIRRALLDWGVPETVKIDNGREYVAKYTQRVLNELNVQVEICPPFSPWTKPFIERFFRSFNHDVLELLPGFIGHNVAERKDIESRKSFSERLFEKNQVIEVNMTSEEFQKSMDTWGDNLYMHKKHDGLGCSPFEVVSSWKEPVRRITDERALDVLLQPFAGGNGKRTVGKKGLIIERGNYIAPELSLHIGREVAVFEIADDLGRVLVKDIETGEFICIAECPERTGISRAEVAAKAKAIWTKHIQELKAELKRSAKRINTKGIAREILSNAATNSSKIVSLPRPHEEYTTPALEAAAEAAELIEARDQKSEERLQRRENSIKILRERADELEAEFQAEMEAQARQKIVKNPDNEKYLRWKELDASITAGEMPSEKDALFYREFQKTAKFRAMKGMEEDFKEFYRMNARG